MLSSIVAYRGSQNTVRQLSGNRQPWRLAHHNHDSAGNHERHRPGDEHTKRVSVAAYSSQWTLQDQIRIEQVLVQDTVKNCWRNKAHTVVN